jgi:hypothetical protein
MSGGAISLWELNRLSGFEFSDALQNDVPQISQITILDLYFRLKLHKHRA